MRESDKNSLFSKIEFFKGSVVLSPTYSENIRSQNTINFEVEVLETESVYYCSVLKFEKVYLSPFSISF